MVVITIFLLFSVFIFGRRPTRAGIIYFSHLCLDGAKAGRFFFIFFFSLTEVLEKKKQVERETISQTSSAIKYEFTILLILFRFHTCAKLFKINQELSIRFNSFALLLTELWIERAAINFSLCKIQFTAFFRSVSMTNNN